MELLPAADLLVSFFRYEAFGLNVQEAICRSIPAIVSESAGIAELYPSDLRFALLKDPESTAELVGMLKAWRESIPRWRDSFVPFSNKLRSYTWSDMARRIVEMASLVSPRHC